MCGKQLLPMEKKEKTRSTRVMEGKGGVTKGEEKSIDSVAEKEFPASEMKLLVGDFWCIIRRQASRS